MAEYLSPGVYVEEFESGGKPMEGVGTSTAGFVGLPEKGPVGGIPQLVTNFADFRRKYGDFLSENEFGEYRFLAYAVEHFFVNGGTRCFITRVAPESAKCSEASVGALGFTAKDPGVWGDSISVKLFRSSKARTQALEKIGEGKYRVKNASGFNPGDIVMFSEGSSVEYNKVEKNQDNVLTFEKDFSADITDTDLLPTKVLTTCELTLEVRYADTAESYENVSFNIEAANYIEKKTAKSDIISVTYSGSNETGDLLASLAEDAGDVVTVEFSCGNNGAASDVSAADFIIAHRDIFSSSYAGLYHPWLQVFDSLDKKNIAIPPSGSVMGLFARSDNARGVHKAPLTRLSKRA